MSDLKRDGRGSGRNSLLEMVMNCLGTIREWLEDATVTDIMICLLYTSDAADEMD